MARRPLTACALVLFLIASGFSQPLAPYVIYEGGQGPGAGKHVVLVSGDEEYRSEEALPMLGKILARHHGFRCTVLFALDHQERFIDPMNQTNIPGLEALQSADLMIIFTRFRELPDEQMKHIAAYVDSGKPIIGIRTATHAFNYRRNRKSPYARYDFRHGDWKDGFGRQILGETWVNHHGRHGGEATRGVIEESAKDHPILRGVSDVFGPTDVYGVRDLPEDARVLLRGQVLAGMKPTDAPVKGKKNDPMMPLVWIREMKLAGGGTRRVMCSTIGASVDFLSADLRRVFVNASFWCTGLEKSIPAAAKVDLVGPYHPRFYGFAAHRFGVRPRDHAMDALVPAAGRLRLANIFSDHMVLQRGKPVRIWGDGDPGEQVTVTFAGQEKSARANRLGGWSVTLDPMPANARGGALVATGAHGSVRVRDVVVGEVWVLGGQSNMVWKLRATSEFQTKDMKVLLKARATTHVPNLRFVTLPLRSRRRPQRDFPLRPDGRGGRPTWQVSGEKSAVGFSGVGFYFGRHLTRELGVPVGLINTAWGGTPAWAWVDQRRLVNHPPIKDEARKARDRANRWNVDKAIANHEEALARWEKRAEKARSEGKRAPRKPRMGRDPAHGRGHPGGPFNGMVHPLRQLVIRGALYYQGENNVFSRTRLYPEVLPLVIASWRRAFGQRDLPFGIFQMHCWEDRSLFHQEAWIREAQLATHLTVPRTGLFVTIDTGEGIHTPIKRPAGERAARWALNAVYGKKDVTWRSPLYSGMRRDGSRIVVEFHEGTADALASSGELKGFVIAGEDRKFHPARARIVGRTVEVWSDAVSEPAAVRYAWGDWPKNANLRSGDLPASPFRTDRWEVKLTRR